MIKKYGDIISSAVFLVVTIIYSVGTFDLQTENIGGNALIPRLVSVVLGISCLQILITSSIKLYKGRNIKDETGVSVNEDKKAPSEYIRVVGTLVLISIYAIIFPLVGFIISTPLYLFAQIYLLTPKDKRKIVPPVIIATVFTAFIYLVFTHVFFFILPKGRIW